jgi:hypothetical protein
MAFNMNKEQNTLPLWMQTLLDKNSIDAWTEDPDSIQHTKRLVSSSIQGNNIHVE